MAQPNDLGLTSDQAARLTRSQQRIVQGSKEVLRTPFMKDETPEAILDLWDKVFQSNTELLEDDLITLEESNRSKFGPRSIMKPWSERKDSLLSYFTPYRGERDPNDLVELMPQLSYRPQDLQSASRNMRLNTSSGLPFLEKKRWVIKAVLKNFSYYKDRKDPYVLFTRTQEGGKTRNVWGDSIARTLWQTQYFPHVLSVQRRSGWRNSLTGPDAVNKKLTEIIDSTQRADGFLISIDFSSYDASVKYELAGEMFISFMQSLFQIAYSDDIAELVKEALTTGIVTPDGLIEGVHANASGWKYTTEINSLTQKRIANLYNEAYILYDITGDDGAYGIHGSNVDELFNLFRSFGLLVNEDKSYVSKHYLVYLQNYYSPAYRKGSIIPGIFPTYRALMRIVYQERWSDFENYGIPGEDYYSLRTISILENCKHHPLFKKLVEFVHRNFNLNYSQSNLRKYIRLSEDSKGKADAIRNQYSDNASGISSFDTVKLLRELS